MFTVGLTGGIGSGKTAVSDRFKAKNITVIDADLISRVVVEKGKPALTEIQGHFGTEIILADGNLNRSLLRDKIFENENERAWLEQLLHPLIRDEIVLTIQQATSPYTILVSPLLIETNQYKLVNRIAVVDVPENVQLKRAAARDKNSEPQIKAIMAAQSDRQVRLSYADDIIDNSNSIDSLDVTVNSLHQRYLTLAKDHDSK